MLVGLPPFYHGDSQNVYSFILQKEVYFPKQIPISVEAKDIIKRLLKKSPGERLGASTNGYKDVLAHPWLKEFDEKILTK